MRFSSNKITDCADITINNYAKHLIAQNEANYVIRLLIALEGRDLKIEEIASYLMKVEVFNIFFQICNNV